MVTGSAAVSREIVDLFTRHVYTLRFLPSACAALLKHPQATLSKDNYSCLRFETRTISHYVARRGLGNGRENSSQPSATVNLT